MWTKANLIGAHPALDFLNTVGDTGKTRDVNHLVSPRDFVSWLEFCGLSSEILVDPVPTHEEITELVRFREIAYQALISTLEETNQQSRNFRRYEGYLKSALQRATFCVREKHFVWRANKEPGQHILDSIVLQFYDLLQSTDIARIRQCERCSWLFINSGRGRGRRWCNMATCGNRHKVEAHRERKTKLPQPKNLPDSNSETIGTPS